MIVEINFVKQENGVWIKMTKQIKASFNVDEKLWDDFKIWCIKNKVTMTEKLEELLKEVLKR